MATYVITTASLTDNVVSLTLADATGLVAGEHVIVYNVGQHFDGHQQLISVDLGTDVVTYHHGGPDVAEFSPVGAVLTTEVTWADTDDVNEFLGIATATANDTAFLESCTNAANSFCYRRRKEAGYVDNPTIVPDPAAKLAVVIYASSLYRERGSIDGFQSFSDMSVAVTPSFTMGRVLQLLGCGRPQVA